MKNNYWVLAYYDFSPIADPHQEVELHRSFFTDRDATARVYISEEGINGQLCAVEKDAQSYIEWMHSRPAYKNLHFKIHKWHEQVYPRLSIKYRKQLVALDAEVDLSKQGDYLTPGEWKAKLDGQEPSLLLDVRNDYEWDVGRFKGAERPACKTFREFKEYADSLKKTHGPGKPVMMYCTGGIRCELYSSVLKEKGFENVFQLKGGVIGYGLEEGSKHWEGKLFVFDDRMTVPISEEETPVVGACHFCKHATDAYYNCANMDCNELFLCCPECLNEYAGCCRPRCQEAPRVRPYHQQNPHKPFRKKHQYG